MWETCCGHQPEALFLLVFAFTGRHALACFRRFDIVHLVGLSLSYLHFFLSHFALIPREIINGRVWEIWTGQLVQPVNPMMTALAAVTIGLWGRELEERVSSLHLLLIYALFCTVTSILWIAVQFAADALGLFAGLSTPLTSFPAVTAVVACRLGQSPLSRIEGPGHSFPMADRFIYLLRHSRLAPHWDRALADRSTRN